MNILHISTSDTGGAGIAATRLHLNLLEHGINSRILYLRQRDFTIPNSTQFELPAPPRIHKRLLYKIGILTSLSKKVENLKKSFKGEFEIATLPISIFKVECHELVKSADIIHLHWVADFINYPTFFRDVNKPIVWTLHDMNPFMGIFHYRGDRERNPNLSEIEQQYCILKAKHIKKASNISFISLCNWMEQECRANQLLKHIPIKKIPNSLNFNTFRILDKNLCKSVFNIPNHKKIILFVAQNIQNKRKGFDLLVNAINGLKLAEEFIYVALGNKPLTSHINNLLFLENIEDERLLTLVYNMADIFVLPSREDNLPNTMLEAFACGIPIITFNNGGMAEYVKQNINGISSEEISEQCLKEMIESMVNKPHRFSASIIRKEALKEFGQEKQFELIYSHYSHQLSL